MKKVIYFILCVIFCTLICRALTNRNILMSEKETSTVKEILNKEVEGDDISSGKIYIKKPECRFFNRQLLRQAKKDPYLFYIVDKNNLLTSDFAPDDLVGEDKKVRKETYEAFKRMANAAKKENIDLFILSGFRTYKYQESLFTRSVSNKGIEHANKYVARPGTSQHQLGTAVDINSVEDSFVNTKEYAWLRENAEKFGFSLSFPKGQEEKTGYAFEPWHYRYITPEGCQTQKRRFNDSQVDFLNAINACLK